MRSDRAEAFPPRRRIGRRTGFDSAFRAERKTNTWFAVHVRKNDCGFARLGVAVSKKIMPGAVARNFAKRLVREMFRRDFPSRLGVDIVVRPVRQIGSETAAEGRKALAQLLQAIAA